MDTQTLYLHNGILLGNEGANHWTTWSYFNCLKLWEEPDSKSYRPNDSISMTFGKGRTVRTENRPGVARGENWVEILITGEHKKHFRVMEIYIFIVVVAQLYTLTKTRRCMLFKRVNFRVCKLYINKSDFKKKKQHLAIMPTKLSHGMGLFLSSTRMSARLNTVILYYIHIIKELRLMGNISQIIRP